MNQMLETPSSMICFSNTFQILFKFLNKQQNMELVWFFPCFLYGASTYGRGHCLGGQETKVWKYKVVYLRLLEVFL